MTEEENENPLKSKDHEELDADNSIDGQDEQEELDFQNETPMADENQIINRTLNHEKFFHDLFLEVLDFERGFDKSKVSFTTALLNQGADFNPQGIYRYIEMVNERLSRIHIVKRLCMSLGLAVEMDAIVDHELQLIY